MPIGLNQEKKDNKQILLDLIEKQFGLSNAVIMEKALKTQDKQIEQAMLEGGASLEQIGQSRGVDVSLLDRLMQNQGSIKAVGEGQPQVQTQQPQAQPQQAQPQTQQKGGGVMATALPALGKLMTMMGEAYLGQPIGSTALRQSETQLNLARAGQQQQLTPEGQLATLLKTQGLMKEQGIKGKVDVGATGVPSISVAEETGLSALEPDQQVAAYALAREIGGVRGAVKVLPSVIENLQAGKSIEQTRDELRYMEQSKEFSKDYRSAAQQLMAGESRTMANNTFDYLDDLVEQGDTEGAKSFLKRMAIKQASTDQANLMTGKERTVEFLEEIENDLSALEKSGMPTGFFSGNLENIVAKVGQVKNPEMRKVATKIATAIMQYRRSMTGVQFGMLENKEYKTLFPNINKVGAFNTATIGALKETFRGDLDKFYSLSMGDKNYKKLFGEGQEDLSQMSDEELRRIAGGK